MFRLVFLLCAGLFLTLLIGGQDRGQLRFGLMAVPEAEAPISEAAEAETEVLVEVLLESPVEVTNAAFAPATPVMVTPVVSALAATEIAEPVAVAPAEPPAFEPKIFYINAKSVNVRAGPGKSNPVIARLTRDEAVLVVSQTDSESGWSLIRIEGDGVEGYVATQLLRE